MPSSVTTYASLLKRCIRKKSLQEGKQLHALIIENGMDSNIFICNTLINMYGSCSTPSEARKVFLSMPHHTLFSWTAIISAYATHDHAHESLRLFSQMLQAGVIPDKAVYAIALKACTCVAALHQGKQIHSFILQNGLHSDVIVCTALIDMYAKCGCIQHAGSIFNKMCHHRDVILWTAMIAGYAQQGLSQQALSLFQQMQMEGIMPDKLTFVSILKACADLSASQQGKHVHALITKSGLELDAFVANTLVIMYAKCGSIGDACRVFSYIQHKDAVSWNAMISGYVHQGYGKEALTLFQQMQEEGVQPNSFTFLSVLKACTILGALKMGKQVHMQIIKNGLELDAFLGSSLVDMYAKFNNIQEARRVFDTMHEMKLSNVVLWNVMIAAYAHQECGDEAFILFEQMKEDGVKPNNITFVGMLKACASLGLVALDCGKQLHSQIVKSGLKSDILVCNTLVDMYAKCGSIEHASQVFCSMDKRDVVSWTAMIAAYAQEEHGDAAFTLFRQMQVEGVKPNDVTFVSILKSCGSLADMDRCKHIHAHIIESGLESHIFVGSTLVDTYVKCGSVEEARKVFDKMQKKDVVLWTAMIAGYAEDGLGEEALTLFEQMQREGVKPNTVTYVNILKACTNLAALERGKEIHSCILQSGFKPDLTLENVLIDMYAKCGSIEDAHKVFNQMCERDMITWTSIITAYAQRGFGMKALALFEQMQACMKPDPITFISVLAACSHAGLMDEGCCYFDSMVQSYGIPPMSEHYACMIDLFGRAGCLDEAEDLISRMPILPDDVVWKSLLGACRSHGKVELGECTSEYVQMLELGTAETHLLLSTIYAAAGRWNAVAKLKNELEKAESLDKALLS